MSKIIFPLAMFVTGIGLGYTVITGDGLGTDIHYNTLGRVVTAVALVVVAGLAIHSWVSLRKLDRMREENRND